MDQKEQTWQSIQHAVNQWALTDPQQLIATLHQQLPALLQTADASPKLAELIHQLLYQIPPTCLNPLRPLFKDLIVTLCQITPQEHKCFATTMYDLLVWFGFTQPLQKRQYLSDEWSQHADLFLNTPLLPKPLKLTLLTHFLISPIYDEFELHHIIKALLTLPTPQLQELTTLIAVIIGHNTESQLDPLCIQHLKKYCNIKHPYWNAAQKKTCPKTVFKNVFMQNDDMKHLMLAIPLHYLNALQALHTNTPGEATVTVLYELLQYSASLLSIDVEHFETLAASLTHPYFSLVSKALKTIPLYEDRKYELKPRSFERLFTHNRSLEAVYPLFQYHTKLRHLIATQWTAYLAFKRFCAKHADQLDIFSKLHDDILTKMLYDPPFEQAISRLIQSNPKPFITVMCDGTLTPLKQLEDARCQTLALLLKYDEKKFTLACQYPALTGSFRGLNYLLLFSEGLLRFILSPTTAQLRIRQGISDDPIHPLPRPNDFNSNLLSLDCIHQVVQVINLDHQLYPRLLHRNADLYLGLGIVKQKQFDKSSTQIYIYRSARAYEKRNRPWEILTNNPEFSQQISLTNLKNPFRLEKLKLLIRYPRCYIQLFQHLTPKTAGQLLFDIMYKGTNNTVYNLILKRSIVTFLLETSLPEGFNLIEFCETDFFAILSTYFEAASDNKACSKRLSVLSWILGHIAYPDLIELAKTVHYRRLAINPLSVLSELNKFNLLDLYSDTQLNAQKLLSLWDNNPSAWLMPTTAPTIRQYQNNTLVFTSFSSGFTCERSTIHSQAPN